MANSGSFNSNRIWVEGKQYYQYFDYRPSDYYTWQTLNWSVVSQDVTKRQTVINLKLIANLNSKYDWYAIGPTTIQYGTNPDNLSTYTIARQQCYNGTALCNIQVKLQNNLDGSLPLYFKTDSINLGYSGDNLRIGDNNSPVSVEGPKIDVKGKIEEIKLGEYYFDYSDNNRLKINVSWSDTTPNSIIKYYGINSLNEYMSANWVYLSPYINNNSTGDEKKFYSTTVTFPFNTPIAGTKIKFVIYGYNEDDEIVSEASSEERDVPGGSLYLYKNKQWKNGTPWVYKDGWKRATKVYTYDSGIWKESKNDIPYTGNIQTPQQEEILTTVTQPKKRGRKKKSDS